MNIKQKPCGLHCIKFQNISVTIGKQKIIEDVNLHIHCGKLNVIIGKNGAGKSTLVKAILNEIPHQGTIEFKDHGNQNIQNLKIGYVPQSLNIDRNTPTSVYDLIAGFTAKRPLFFPKSKGEYNKIKGYLATFEAEDLIDKQVGKLSGGELQRVLLTLATVDEPNLLVLDEPVSGIDKNGMDLFYQNIENLKRNYDIAIILVSHDLEYVAKYADGVILLDSKVLKKGTVEQVYTSDEFKEIFGNLQYDLSAIRNRKYEKEEEPICR